MSFNNTDDWSDKEKLLTSIYNNVKHGICLNEVIYKKSEPVDYRIIEANKSFEKILQIPRDEAIGALGYELLNIKKNLILKKFNEIENNNDSREMEVYFPQLNKYFHITITSLQKGKFLSIFYDITDKKKRLLKIREQKENFSLLVNNLPGMVYKCLNNKRWTMKYVSAGCEELTGFNPEEIIDDKEISYDSLVVEEYKKKVFAKVNKALKNHESFKVEYKINTKNNEELWVLEQGKGIYDKDSNVKFIHGVITNIDKRKRAEYELKSKKNNLMALNQQLTAYNEKILEMNDEIEKSYKEIKTLNHRFSKMIELFSNIDKKILLSEEKFFADLLKKAISIVPEADYGKFCIIDEDNYCRFVGAIGHDINILKKIKITKDKLLNIEEKGIHKAKDYFIKTESLSEKQKELFSKALKEIKDSLYINITVKGDTIGRIALDIKKGSNEEFTDITYKILNSFSALASAFFSFKRLDNLKTNFTKELIKSIIKILEMYDPYTKGHSENVAQLSSLIGEKMGLANKDIQDIYWAGLVHDIGKLIIPTHILNKKERLSDEEYELIKKHPVYGWKALNSSESLKSIANYVLYHHEKWDGKGYPHGLKDNDIPLISQILAVADAWDAMTSERSYRKPLSTEKAKKELIANKGTQFSPKVVDAFLNIINEKKIQKLKNNILEKNILNSDYQIESKTSFEKLFNEASEAIVILDNNYSILRANDHFVKMFGYKKSELKGKNIKKNCTRIKEKRNRFIYE